ncbi:MAG: oligosaccharide flippase family protein [Candidatus Gorgyraea atricola]|nr:oligosaccharide flippase family protein [Candidatus Gorgyraea atricola]
MQQRELDRKNVIRDTSFFSGSVYISQAMFFIRGFLNAKILGPELYGVWSFLNIILRYSVFAHLGSFNAMAREIPYENGKRSNKGMDRVRNVVFTFSLCTISIFALGVIIVAILLWKRLLLYEAVGLIVIAALAVSMALYEFCQTSLIGVKRFVLISKANVLFPILSVLLTLLFVPRLKIYGVYIVALVIPILTVTYLYMKESFKLKLCFDLKEIYRLLKIGFPIMSSGFLQGTITNIAGIMTLSFLGKTNMGYYSVAALATNFLMYFPMSIHRSFEPHIYQRYGETHDIGSLKKYLFKPMLVMSLLFPVALAFYYTGVTFFIRHFLSKYTVAIYPFSIILIARFFLAFSPTAVAIITVLNKQRFLVPVYLSGIAIAFVSGLVFINQGFGIVAVALGLLLSFFFVGTVIFIYSMKQYIKSPLTCIGYLVTMSIPLVYMIGVIFFNEIMIPVSVEILPDIFVLVMRLLTVAGFSIPLIYIAHRKTGILHDVAGFIRRKR